MLQIFGSYGHEHLKNGGKRYDPAVANRLPAVFKVFMPLQSTATKNLQHTPVTRQMYIAATVRYNQVAQTPLNFFSSEGISQMRRAILIFLAVLLLLVVLLPLAGYLWLRTSLPQTSGTARAQGLNGEVAILRDRAGIPHIFATNDHDAFFALGYGHGTARLW